MNYEEEIKKLKKENEYLKDQMKLFNKCLKESVIPGVQMITKSTMIEFDKHGTPMPLVATANKDKMKSGYIKIHNYILCMATMKSRCVLNERNADENIKVIEGAVKELKEDNEAYHMALYNAIIEYFMNGKSINKIAEENDKKRHVVSHFLDKGVAFIMHKIYDHHGRMDLVRRYDG